MLRNLLFKEWFKNSWYEKGGINPKGSMPLKKIVSKKK